MAFASHFTWCRRGVPLPRETRDNGRIMSLPLDCPRRFIHSIPRRRGTIGICVALLTLCSISSPRGAQPSATTLAAIVNESGVLAPIVRFDGSAWRHSWPEPGTVVAADVAAGTTAPLAWTGGVPYPA